MKKDKFKTHVIFRKFKNEILALFPYMICSYNGDVTCYAHLEQHSNADYNYIITNSKPINDPKNLNLYKELISIGYDLKTIKRQNYNKYIEELKSIRNYK
tara:strand:+ start:190 stop:489 length:300 start_codon:yes stop_codon:yes gene_type:complete